MISNLRDVVGRARRWLERPVVTGERALLRRVEGRPFVRVEDSVALFLVPWPTGVTGGYLSILELLDETHRIGLALGFDTHACDVPGARTGARLPTLANTWTLSALDRTMAAYSDAATVWIHVPSHMVDAFTPELIRRRHAVSATSQVIVNVLNQHIQLVPQPATLRSLAEAGFEVTMTTAHRAYATAEWAQHFGVPLHHISTWLSRERYAFARHAPKADRVLLSHDNLSANDKVITALPRKVTHQVIRDMSYDDYLRLVFRSKWSLTFGEGLDAYFIEMALSGGVPLASFNDRFFTPEFADLPNVYRDVFVMMRRAPTFIARMRSDPALLQDINRQTVELLDAQYDIADHRERLTHYYLGDYEFVPS